MKRIALATLLLGLLAGYLTGKRVADHWYARFPVVVSRYVYGPQAWTGNPYYMVRCWSGTAESTATTATQGSSFSSSTWEVKP